ncbi:hypothetical protein FDECE_6838 [Fusarium decemcellulare]|nr:hypothetical protein FDECE_6838 [Fusarium decemcellulare]
MSPDAQLESDFITRLPREVRDGIYLELWRSCGLRQHIVWHDDQADRIKSHFCRWRCTTPFQVEDKLQEDIDALRIQLGVSLGDSFSNKTYASRLYSAWRNHWACGERVEDVYGGDGDVLESTSRKHCWIRRGLAPRGLSTWSPFLSMLLSCKIISSECLESIYKSITFIFTDLVALNMFVGFCKVPPFLQTWPKMGIPPPSFRTHGKHLELSLAPVFPMLLSCSSPRITEIPEERHNSLDFHGLRLDLLENLTTLDIWIAARSTYFLIDQYGRNFDQSPYNLTQLNIEQLRMALSHLERVNNVTLSIPLAQSAGPEDGYIDDAALPSGLHIWRRGAGDRFHPSLHPIVKKKHLASSVYSSKDRQVKLSYNPYVDEDWPPTQLPSIVEGPRFEPTSGRMARLMESIRSKRKWLGRGR